MSNRYLGGFITDTPTQPTTTSAPGMWTLSQVSQAVGNAIWPSSSYQIANSLRFRSSASAYLNRTPSVAGNQKTWTFSAWVKRGQLGATQIIAEAGTSGTTFTYIAYFNASDQLVILDSTVSGVSSARTSTAVFRDPSAWYHIVVNLDATNSVCNGYVNGVAQTFTGTQPSNQNWAVNSAIEHRIGRAWGANTNYFDGYLADINFIDGQALTPSSFGQISTVTGVWQPKAYSGTYGTNGFKLNFSNGTSTTTLGYDSSGNSNNWTTNNISLTAGSTYDWMLDSPTPFAGTSYGVGNYCVISPIDKYSTATISNGNLYVSVASTSTNRGTIGVSSGQWYWEVYVGASPANPVGIATNQANLGSYVGSDAYGWGYNNNASKYNNGTATSYGSTFASGDTIGVALDMSAGTITFYKNNVSQGQAFSGITGTVFPACGGQNFTFNFGQQPFAYTPPTGYKSLCTYNLPTPSIVNGASYMAATTYTGTGASQAISNAVNGVSFQPDFVWAKQRGVGTDHVLYDVIRTGTYSLTSNNTAAEVNQTSNGCTVIFSSNGFTAGADTAGYLNYPGRTYVGWQWKANGTAVSNTAGSITSQVSANTTSGFAVVTYTSPSSTASAWTVGHGLGVAPSMIISKERGQASAWLFYHASLGNTQFMQLNGTGAASSTNAPWNNTSPTSTVATFIGNNFDASTTQVFYCFAAIPGYSAFGSYTGNGSTDGPFVYTGFRPRYILVKCTNHPNPTQWVIWDTARNPYNLTTYALLANTSDAELNNFDCDILSNGFKLRDTEASLGASGYTYIYAAFAENPFSLSLAR